MIKEIKKLISKWVSDNFGKSELEDPSWNIDHLAEYLSKNLKIEELEIYKETLKKIWDSSCSINTLELVKKAFNDVQNLEEKDESKRE